MAEIILEKRQIKPLVLEVLNDLFNISDIEEAKRTPIGRLINLEAKVENLAHEVRQLEASLRAEMNALRSEMNSQRAEMSSLRAEMKSMEKVFDAKFDQLNSRLAFQEKLQYLILAAVVGGVIKVIFFP